MVRLSTDDITWEIGSGIWFITSAALALLFVSYAIRLFTTRRDLMPTLAAAVILAILDLGSAMRGFLNWMAHIYINRGWDPAGWLDLWPGFGISIALNIAGAILGYYIFAARWRLCVTLVMLAIAIAVPIYIYHKVGYG